MILLQFKPISRILTARAAAAESACGHLMVTERPAAKGRIRVLLVRTAGGINPAPP